MIGTCSMSLQLLWLKYVLCDCPCVLAMHVQSEPANEEESHYTHQDCAEPADVATKRTALWLAGWLADQRAGEASN